MTGVAATPDRVLVINAGSSSLKYQLVEPATGDVAASGLVERIGNPDSGARRHLAGGRRHEDDTPVADAAAAFAAMLDAFSTFGPDLSAALPVAVGHRVVHGGAEFDAATVIDDDVLDRIRGLVPLAPLHNPAAVTGIELARSLFPTTPQVAVFDTAFHRTIPALAHTYAVPRRWRDDWGVRRYGFHGTSHRYVSGRLGELTGGSARAMVVLHLGNGASACAVLDGRSVETSMGLTPLEGLVMGTRSGDIDPAIAGHLARRAGMSAEQVDAALNRDCGLLGLTGAGDFRTVVERASAGDADCLLAIDVVTHRIVKYVGAYAATMGRLDAVVFTGGIGENSPLLRNAVLQRLTVFGVRMPSTLDTDGPGERCLTAPDSPVQGWVVPTDEERQIARESAAAVTLRPSAPGTGSD